MRLDYSARLVSVFIYISDVLFLNHLIIILIFHSFLNLSLSPFSLSSSMWPYYPKKRGHDECLFSMNYGMKAKEIKGKRLLEVGQGGYEIVGVFDVEDNIC